MKQNYSIDEQRFGKKKHPNLKGSKDKLLPFIQNGMYGIRFTKIPTRNKEIK